MALDDPQVRPAVRRKMTAVVVLLATSLAVLIVLASPVLIYDARGAAARNERIVQLRQVTSNLRIALDLNRLDDVAELLHEQEDLLTELETRSR